MLCFMVIRRVMAIVLLGILGVSLSGCVGADNGSVSGHCMGLNYYYIFEYFIAIGSIFLAVVFTVHILRRSYQPSGAVAWVLAFVLLPYVAVPLYILIGGRKLYQISQEKNPLSDEGFGAGELFMVPPRSNMEKLLIKAGMPATREENIVVLHHNGETVYTVLMELIESAQKTINIMTFILGRDDVGRNIVNALAKKAEEGVEVRLLLDGLGCLYTSGRFVDPLRRAGGQVGHFLPVLPLRRKWSANLRNHRKIVVVDSESALVGGMNLASPYMGPYQVKTRFLDSAVFVRGPAVHDIEEVFTSDWHYATEEAIPVLPQITRDAPRGNGLVQVMASGPDVPDDLLHDAILTALMEAKERIWVVTPYFVPDDTILKLLLLQARIGRDVRIVVPKRSNHIITDYARGPALRRLVHNGARIFAYPKNMVHAKALVFDNQVAITGSPNLDMRSLYLNFEIALFHYSQAEINQTAQWMEDLMMQSEDVDGESSGFVRECAEGVAGLLSPLL